MPVREFQIAPEWQGQTSVILGGGPSLNAKDIAYCRHRGWKRIACNDAFRLDPEADVLCWADTRWYDWNQSAIRLHYGLKITWSPFARQEGVRVQLMRRRHSPPALSDDPGAITATSTGQGALNIAYHFRANRIVLLGFDMRVVRGKHNWHDFHQKNMTGVSRYLQVFGPAMQAAGVICAKAGITIINATEGSALRCFPFQKLRKIA